MTQANALNWKPEPNIFDETRFMAKGTVCEYSIVVADIALAVAKPKWSQRWLPVGAFDTLAEAQIACQRYRAAR